MHVSKKHATEREDYTVITQCPPIQGISTCLLAERAQLSSHPACVLSASLLQGRRRSRGLYRDKPQISCSPGARCRDMRKLKQTCSAPSAKWDELSFLCSEVPSPSLIAQEVQSASGKRRGRWQFLWNATCRVTSMSVENPPRELKQFIQVHGPTRQRVAPAGKVVLVTTINYQITYIKRNRCMNFNF